MQKQTRVYQNRPDILKIFDFERISSSDTAHVSGFRAVSRILDFLITWMQCEENREIPIAKRIGTNP